MCLRMNVPTALRQNTCFGPSISSLQIPLNQAWAMIHLHLCALSTSYVVLAEESEGKPP